MCTTARFFLQNKPFRRITSGSNGPIFTKFSPYGRYLIADYRPDPLFPIVQGTLPWQPILGQNGRRRQDLEPTLLLLVDRLMGQYCFARWRLSSVGVVVVCRGL